MPVDKNKLRRYRILNELLSDRSRYYTIKDLEKLGSQRLIEDGFNGVSVKLMVKHVLDIAMKVFLFLVLRKKKKMW